MLLSGSSWASYIRVIDADPIVVSGVKVRLNGIVAAEMAIIVKILILKCIICGAQSTLALYSILGVRPDKIVECKYTGTDIYGHLVGECSIGSVNINMWLVENGWALAYRH